MKQIIQIFAILIFWLPALSYSNECNLISIDALAEKGVKIEKRLFDPNEIEVNFNLPAPKLNDYKNVVRFWLVQESGKMLDVPLYGNFESQLSAEIYQFSISASLISQANISVAYYNSKNQRTVYCVKLS